MTPFHGMDIGHFIVLRKMIKLYCAAFKMYYLVQVSCYNQPLRVQPYFKGSLDLLATTGNCGRGKSSFLLRFRKSIFKIVNAFKFI